MAVESLVDGLDDKRMRALLKQLAAENPQVQRELAGQMIEDGDDEDDEDDEEGAESGDEDTVGEIPPSGGEQPQQQELELRESFLQRKPERARPRGAELKAAAGVLADATPTRLQRELSIGEADGGATGNGGGGGGGGGEQGLGASQAAASGMSSRYDLKGKGKSRAAQMSEMSTYTPNQSKPNTRSENL